MVNEKTHLTESYYCKGLLDKTHRRNNFILSISYVKGVNSICQDTENHISGCLNTSVVAVFLWGVGNGKWGGRRGKEGQGSLMVHWKTESPKRILCWTKILDSLHRCPFEESERTMWDTIGPRGNIRRLSPYPGRTNSRNLSIRGEISFVLNKTKPSCPTHSE